MTELDADSLPAQCRVEVHNACFSKTSLSTRQIYGITAPYSTGEIHGSIDARLPDPSRFLLWENVVHFLLGAERADPFQGKPVPRRRFVDPELPKQDNSIQHNEVTASRAFT